MVQYILRSTVCIFMLCLLLFAVFVSIFKLLGYLRFLHLNLAHNSDFTFSQLFISPSIKKKINTFKSFL